MRNTKSQEKERPETHVRNLIERAAKIKEAGFLPDLNKSAHQVMAGPLMEALYNLLNSDQEQSKDWGDSLYSLRDLLREMVILLGKPNIVTQLPEWMQGEASKKIFALSEFFESIDHPQTYALMDWESLDYPTEERTINGLMQYYSFNLSALNDKHCNNFLLFDYHIQQNRLAQMNKVATTLD